MQLWEKAHDAAAMPQDQLKMSLQIIEAAFVQQNFYFLLKHCERAQQLDSGRNAVQTQTIVVMSALALFLNERPLEGVKALINLDDSVSLMIDDNPALQRLGVSSQHLAYYLVLACLANLSRLELKSDVISRG